MGARLFCPFFARACNACNGKLYQESRRAAPRWHEVLSRPGQDIRSVRSEESERRSETKQTRREDGVWRRRRRQRQQRRRRLTETTNRKTVACSVLFRSLSLCVVVKRRKRHEKNRLINYCQLNGKCWVNNRVNYFKKTSVILRLKRFGKIKWKTKVKAQQPRRRGENFVVSQNMA